MPHMGQQSEDGFTDADGTYFEEGEYVDADFSPDDTELSENKVIVNVHINEALLEVFGYDTDSDDEAHLCCSECGEPVEFVTEDRDTDDDVPEGSLRLMPNVDYLGAVCGCRETPDKWTMGGI